MTSKLIIALLVVALYCSAMADAQWDGSIWVQKINWFFKQYDVNNDQLQDSQDLNIMVTAFTPKGLVKQTQLTALINAMWATLYAGDPLDPHNAADLVKSLQTLGQNSMKIDVTTFAPNYFTLLDFNIDTYIEQDEWAFYFITAQNMPPSVVNPAFNVFDVNGDGKLSLNEFDNGWMNYFTTNDPANPYNNVLGQVN